MAKIHLLRNAAGLPIRSEITPEMILGDAELDFSLKLPL